MPRINSPQPETPPLKLIEANDQSWRARLVPVLVWLMLGVIWGSTWLAIKIGLNDLPPLTFLGYRLVIAALLLLLYVKLRRLKLSLTRREWGVALFLSFGHLTVPYALIFWGEQYIPSSFASLFYCTMPLFVGALAHFFAQERISWLKVIGVMSGFIGVLIILMGKLQGTGTGSHFLAGSLALLIAAFSSSIATVGAKRLAGQINPAVNTTVQMCLSAALLLPLGLISERGREFNLTPAALTALLYLAVVGSAVAFIAYYWLVQRIRVTMISMMLPLNTLLAVIFGWLLLNEAVGWNLALGAAFIFSGIGLVSYRKQKLPRVV